MNLTKIALLTFFIGIIALMLISNSLEIKLVKISDINEKMLDNYIKLQGKVIKINYYDTLTSFRLNDGTGNITVITYSKINLTQDSAVEVIGKIKPYKGSLEIESERIEIIS